MYLLDQYSLNVHLHQGKIQSLTNLKFDFFLNYFYFQNIKIAIPNIFLFTLYKINTEIKINKICFSFTDLLDNKHHIFFVDLWL